MRYRTLDDWITGHDGYDHPDNHGNRHVEEWAENERHRHIGDLYERHWERQLAGVRPLDQGQVYQVRQRIAAAIGEIHAARVDAGGDSDIGARLRRILEELSFIMGYTENPHNREGEGA